MDYKFLCLHICVILYFDFISYLTAIGEEALVTEYCQGEDFQPSCDRDEVLVIQSAHYGSMNIGRCLAKDYGHLGCFTDVKDIADRICSGRRSCLVRVSNKEMDDKRECQDDFTRYMEVSYRCQKVLTPRHSSCSGQLEVEASVKSHYLASLVTIETKCGLTDTPWVLQAKPGQQINLTLINFKYTPDDGDQNEGPCSVRLGYLFDMENEEVINICIPGQRVKYLYTSNGNRLQVLLDRNMLDEYTFLLEYHAIGCPLVKLPEGTWSKQEGNMLKVGCLHSQTEWSLRCHGNHWIGISQNCMPEQVTTEVTPEMAAVQHEEEENYMHNLLVVTIVGSVTLLGCVVVIVIGAVCIKRLNSQLGKQKHKQSVNGQNYTLKSMNNRNSILTSYLPMFDPATQHTLRTGTQTNPCLLSHQSSEGEPCVCQTQTYKSTSDRDSVQYYVLDQDYMANSQMK